MQVAALAAMALLGLADFWYGNVVVVSGDAGVLVAATHVALAVATAAVFLPAHRQGSRRLAAAAGLVATASLAVTAARFVLVETGGWSGRVTLRGGDGLWGVAEAAGLLGVVFVVARRAAPVPAAFVVAATGLAVAVQPMRISAASTHQLAGMACALLAAGAAAAGAYLRLAATARDRQLATVRAEQRAEFARDLHDFIAHHVTGIVVQAQGAQYVAARDPGRAVTALGDIERAGAETLTAMRRLVGVLRGPDDAPEAPLGGVADLPELLESFTAAGPTRAHLHTDGSLDGLPVDVTSTVYRVVMEALTNVRQHATGARRVDVRLTRTRERLSVRVTDDGPARAGRPRDRRGFGLVGLTERVGALGGRLVAGPGADGGWTVDATLPAGAEAGR